MVPILLYGPEQWLPYRHSRKIHQQGPKGTFTTSPHTIAHRTSKERPDLCSLLPPFLHTNTSCPSQTGRLPHIYPSICRVSYLCDPTCPPLVAKAVIVQKTLAQANKFLWWNNAGRLLQPYNITEATISPNSTPLKTDLQSEYRRWWIEYLIPPSHSPKLDTFRLFHPSFHSAPYLDHGPHYLRPQALQFRCSNHCLDIEL